MTTILPPSEAIEFLRAINRGEITLSVDDPIDQTNPVFHASNGWALMVFNDAGTWDGVYWIQTSDDRMAEFDEIYGVGGYELPESAEPTDEQADQYWHWHEINNPPSSLRFVRH